MKKTREQVFEEYLKDAIPRKFMWGATDCFCFAAGIVEELTGKDFMKPYAYDTEEEARDIVRQAGGVVELVTQHLGQPSPYPAEKAEIGDIVVADTPEGMVLGIASYGKAFFKTEKYVAELKLTNCLMFWSVPFAAIRTSC